MSQRFISVLVTSILLFVAGFVFWPGIVKFFYLSSNISTPISMASLGQLGDSFSPLTSLFTLVTLSFSIYTNYLQYKQFRENKDSENLSIYRSLRKEIFEDKDLIDAIYMIEYNRFRYEGEIKNKVLIQDFFDETEDLRDDSSDKTSVDELQQIVERKIDRLLSYYEEVLTLKDAKVLKGEIYNHIFARVDRALGNGNIASYLENLDAYFHANHPYPLLWRRYKDSQNR